MGFSAQSQTLSVVHPGDKAEFTAVSQTAPGFLAGQQHPSTPQSTTLRKLYGMRTFLQNRAEKINFGPLLSSPCL